jgi:PAS domain S-box-containing protein
MLGYTFDELVKMRPWDLVHPADLKRNLEERRRLISGEAQQVSLETRYLRKDGKVIWIARTVSLVRDASGTPQYFVNVGQDITVRKQSEIKLEEATELSSEAMTASRIAIFRWDLHSGTWEWDRTQSVVGMVPDELLRTLEGMLTLVVPADRAELYERLTRSAREGERFEHEFRVTLPPEGSVTWIYSRGSIIRDQGGQPAYLTGALINMSEYKLLRRQVQDRQEMLLLAESAGGVHPWAVDAISSRRVWWTPASYRLYGRDEKLGPPTRDEFVKLVHPDDQEKAREVYRLLEKTGGEDTFSLQFRTAPKSDGVRWILTKGRVHRDPNGWPLRLVGVDIDVTERRQAGEALRKLEKLSCLERLATGIAHETNNPIMALSNSLFLISQSTTVEEAKKYARLGQEEIARLTYYSNRRLRFHRNSTPLQPLRVGEIVGGILDMLKHRHPDVEVITDFSETRLLESSRTDLELLFGIILGNAFDAIPAEGSVRVRVVERSSVTSESGVRIMIVDSGKGMTAEVKAHLFEPFFSTKNTTGLGLGLWIAARIVGDLGGRIRIRSSDAQANHGTVVSVFLPFRHPLSSGATSEPATAA